MPGTADTFSQYGHFQNQFQNYNPRPTADQFNTNSIRRFPQFPNAASANEEPLISVLSGSNQFHPSQSVSWNPPPTISPPQVSNNRGPSLSRQVESTQGQLFKLESELSHPASKLQNFHLEDSTPNKAQVNLQAGNNNLVDKPNNVVSTTPVSTTTSKEGKKDDVVIYYYYYYDDDKNKTDKEGLDTIPSLEGFDTPKPKPGKVIIKNENYQVPKEVPQPIIPLQVDSRGSSLNVPFSKPIAQQPPQQSPPFKLLEQPEFTVPTTERPTTQPLRTTTLDNQSLISNIFRYGSSSAAPNLPHLTSEPRTFTSHSPSFESNKGALDSITKLPGNELITENGLADLITTPVQTLSPSTLLTTTTTSTTTTTTSTTPIPITTPSTTTTTAASVEEPETSRRPGRFGSRHGRPGISGARPNPLNRIRSSSTTTSTAAPSTSERSTRSFTRPTPASQPRTNRFRKRPGFGNSEPSNSETSSQAATITSTTPSSISRIEASSSAPRGRFGGRSRFSAGRQQVSSSAPQSQTSTTPTAQVSSITENSITAGSTPRRPFNRGLGRPQLRGGNRQPFLRRNNNKPSTEEVTPDPSDVSTPTSDQSSNSFAPTATSLDKPNESVTESSANSSESASSEMAVTEPSSTEKPKGRQRPLFGARPRPNLFGRRGGSNSAGQ